MAEILSTLHARIRGDIEAKIMTGAWRPGFVVPPEHEIMLHYGCSRMTVNKAVSALARSGLVSRNRRAGTVVAKPPLHAGVLQIPDISHEIEARGGVYSYNCIHLELRNSGQCRFIRCLHFEDGVALMLEEREIFLHAIPEAGQVDFKSTPPGSWLMDHVAWTQAEHRISAHSAEGTVARHLGVPVGKACLVVERKTWRGPDTITHVQQFFRGDKFDLSARFSPTLPDC